ncbi:MAG: TDP-4-oxo-6-deoxy-alpha-D-glucose-3,4-oxoisomerase [Alphaproteobacteria bacterium ADurb.Bin438]|nr:MAG: TDP-4-oxo-6-deoxy-alpha-D-glucose-3,4-oxoisomerase [Alphaproteobacteria bacterium ADurb.Bin438]
MVEYKLVDFRTFGDNRGNLVTIEAEQDIPFKVNRVYYIYGSEKEIVRGKHAHKELEQVIFCASGSCDFILDDGKERVTVHLDKPNQGLYIKNNIWREFTNFSEGCVVMVLASNHYDEADYIRNYDDFLKFAKENY